MKPKALIIDDDTSILTVLKALLEREGFEVTTAETSDKGLNIFRNEEFDIILCDIVMKPFDGITLLQQARRIDPDVPIIMMTGFAKIETANKAMKLGAFDYICKPFKIDELQSTVKRAMKYLKKISGEEDSDDNDKKVFLVKKNVNNIVGDGPQMRQVYEMIKNLAITNDAVLVYGDCGTGESLVAKSVHEFSQRAANPFTNFNCAIYPDMLVDSTLFGMVEQPTDEDGNVIKGLPVITKGIIEKTNGGTLFLEEIGALPLEIQHKFLAALREGKICRSGSDKEIHIDVRVIADTTQKLENKVNQQEFLADLLDMFTGNIINVPPLKERTDDIPLLIQYFLLQCNKQENTKNTIQQKAQNAMRKYTWPGNIRELITAVYRSAKICKNEKIQIGDLPVPIRMCYMKGKDSIMGYSDEIDLRWWSLKKFIKTKEKEYVEQVLKATKGDKEKAAKMLGISLQIFEKKYGDEN